MAHSSKNDLILVSYASPRPGGVTLIWSRSQLACFCGGAKQSFSHVLVATSLSKIVNRLLPRALCVDWDPVVDDPQVGEGLNRDGFTRVVLEALVTAEKRLAILQLSAHVRKLVVEVGFHGKCTVKLKWREEKFEKVDGRTCAARTGLDCDIAANPVHLIPSLHRSPPNTRVETKQTLHHNIDIVTFSAPRQLTYILAFSI